MPFIKRIAITNHIEANIHICGADICGNCKLPLKEIIEIVIHKIAKTVLLSINYFFHMCVKYMPISERIHISCLCIDLDNATEPSLVFFKK